MHVSEALKTIQALADGVDPITGEEFPVDSPYQNPQVIRALFTSLRLLEKNVQRQNRDRVLPSNAGKPWDNEDDQKLSDGFDAGMNVSQLAQKHGRTSDLPPKKYLIPNVRILNDLGERIHEKDKV